jgi:hypothetical protein
MFSRVGMGMGIQFVDLSADALPILRKFIDEVG